MTDFERLKEVARLIAKYNPGRVRPIDLDEPQDLYSRYAAALLNPEITHPLQIPDLSEDKSESFLSSVQTQTKDRLHDLIFSLRLTDGSELRNSMFDAHKSRFLAEALSLLGARESGIRVASAGLRESQRLGMTALTLEFLRILRLDALYRNDQKAHGEFTEQVRRTLDLFNAETEAQLLGGEVQTLLQMTGNGTPEAKAVALGNVRRLEYLFSQHRTVAIGLQYYKIATAHAELTLDFERCLILCTEAVSFLHSVDQPVSPSYLGEYALRSCEAALQLRRCTELDQSLATAFGIYPANDPNWMLCMQFQYLREMQASRFAEAFNLTKQVQENPRFRLLPSDRAARWRLFELYASVFQGKAREDAYKPTLKVLYEQLTQDLASYKQDKAGYNFQMMLIEVMLLIDSGDFTTLSAQVERLRVYKNRYLAAGSESRAIADLLIHVCKKYDIPVDVSTKQTYTPANEISIVPYSGLLEHLVSSLQSGQSTSKIRIKQK